MSLVSLQHHDQFIVCSHISLPSTGFSVGFSEETHLASRVVGTEPEHILRGLLGLRVYPLHRCSVRKASHCLVPVYSRSGRSLRDEIFLFCSGPPLRTAPRDHQPPTANHQPPPTANHQPPPTANCQPPPTTNYQPPTAANHHQPPPTTSCQLPTANRRQPPTANRQPPPTMVEHMECPRAFLGKLVPEHFFFSPLRTALLKDSHYPLPSAVWDLYYKSPTAQCPMHPCTTTYCPQQ